MRGLGWGRKHSVVDYVWEHPRSWLVRYHLQVIAEMENRGYNVTDTWRLPQYRGKRCECEKIDMREARDYPEHDDGYLFECLENLEAKGHDLWLKVGVSEVSGERYTMRGDDERGNRQ